MSCAKRIAALKHTKTDSFDPSLVQKIAHHKIDAPEWHNAGKVVGVTVWRIEKFRVVPWPEDKCGQFFDGDSYIVLHTFDRGHGQLGWDIFFWIGVESSQDEYGTAAFKTVELDDFLGGAPAQHREVQNFESTNFQSLFHPCVRILHGGVDSGFHHVVHTFRPRLLHLKGKRNIHVTEAPISHASLNSGDVFVLDGEHKIFIWYGRSGGMRERQKAGELATSLHTERRSVPVIESVDDGSESAEFWAALGGQGPVAPDANDDLEAEKDNLSAPALFRLSDSLTYEEVARGVLPRKLLSSNDVFIVDTGFEVWAWVGKHASAAEKKGALTSAQNYLHNSGKPPYFPIARIVEGGENAAFERAFHH